MFSLLSLLGIERVCYGCLPKARDKLLATQGLIVPIVSLLLALIKDQVHSFRKRGVSAAYVTSDHADAESENMKAGILEGKYQLVFISPEQLIENDFVVCAKVKSTKKN